MKKTTVTPTLSSTHGYLVDVRDQVSSLIRFVIMNPGWTSSIWEDKLLSARKFVAKYEQDRNTLASMLGSAVRETLQQMFNDYEISTEFTAADANEEDDGQYLITFSVLIQKLGEPQVGGMIAGNITTNEKTHDINIKFHKSLDSLTMETISSTVTVRKDDLNADYWSGLSTTKTMGQEAFDHILTSHLSHMTEEADIKAQIKSIVLANAPVEIRTKDTDEVLLRWKVVTFPGPQSSSGQEKENHTITVYVPSNIVDQIYSYYNEQVKA